MTFSIVARDPSGAIGIALSSSSPAVAARCIHLRDRVAGVASQNITDPRYGTTLLDAAEAGESPQSAVERLVSQDPTAPYRQIVVVDGRGRTAVFSGERTLGRHQSAVAEAVAAAGNLLAADAVPDAMVAAFQCATGDLEWRLLEALEAGLAAGGEEGPVHSCGLAVARGAGWNETDLRIDWDDTAPIAALRELLERWVPLRDGYVSRALRPDSAPSYGVPGDE